MNGKTAAVILNGDGEKITVNEEFIVCADGGYDRLSDRKPDLVVGDMDSVSGLPDDIPLAVFERKKNLTDGQIAVERAAAEGYENINIYAALGGRIDHQYGNITLLEYAHTLSVNAVIRDGGTNIYYIFKEKPFLLKAKKGDIISVIPRGASDVFVEESKGLEYPLDGLRLSLYDSRGMSNTAAEDRIYIKIRKGAALVFVIKSKNG